MSKIDVTLKIKIVVVVSFVMLLWVECASAATLVVSKTSPACTTGDAYFTSIKAAVDGANDGDEIVVCLGTYKESREVDKSVYIQSYSGASDTIVESYDPLLDFFKNSGFATAFTVKADQVTIKGFRIKYGVSGISLDEVSHCNIINT